MSKRKNIMFHEKKFKHILLVNILLVPLLTKLLKIT